MLLLSCSLLQLVPLARVKKMMKEVPDVKIVAADASWLVARATVSVLTAAGRPCAACAAAHTFHHTSKQAAALFCCPQSTHVVLMPTGSH
jgi:hypothetical protein